MVKKSCFFFLLCVLHFDYFSQCNGHQSLCNKNYDEVAYLTTHNAFNASSEGFALANQNFGLTAQFNDGVRAVMLDVYNWFGTPTVYHGTAILGTAPLSDNLIEIKDFLDTHPNEIITVILECNVDADDIESELNDTGLSSYLYTHSQNDWPTLQEMIDSNTRLIIFSDVNDASPTQPWYHYMWDYMVETHYSANDTSDFSCDYNRGDGINDLFIFNHFVTSITGTGLEGDSEIANSNPYLIGRIRECESFHNKFPNFITVDFYEKGNALEAVNILNDIYPLNLIENSSTEDFQLQINQENLVITSKEKITDNYFIYGILGKQVDHGIIHNQSITSINIDQLKRGTYLIQIGIKTLKFSKS